MVAIPSLGKIVILAIVGIVGFLFFSRSQQVGIGAAAGEVGTGLGSIGTGVQSFLTGVGTGTAQLLNPAFSLVELARQGGELFGFGGGGRQTQTRPREVATAAAAAQPLTPPSTTQPARYGTRAVGAGNRRSIESNIAQGGLGTRDQYSQALQQSFDAVVGAGQLNSYRGYFTELQGFLTPRQRELL